jgi:hypothetical protein
MFTVLTDLSLITRRDLAIDPSSGILVSGLQGLWVTWNGTGAAYPAAATKFAWPVFNESKRDQTTGQWAPDVLKTTKVTVLAGKYWARTTVFTGSPTVGQYLEVNAAGQLAAGSASSTNVALCMVAPRSIDYLGTTVSAMDIYVI